MTTTPGKINSWLQFNDRQILVRLVRVVSITAGLLAPDDAANWKIVKTHRMSEKEVEQKAKE